MSRDATVGGQRIQSLRGPELSKIADETHGGGAFRWRAARPGLGGIPDIMTRGARVAPWPGLVRRIERVP